MFGTIRRHQTWLWVVIISLTVLSFVVFGPTNTKIGSAFSSAGSYGVLAGKAISRDQIVNAVHEVMLDYFLKNQQWPNADSPDVTRQAYLRLFLIQKQKDFGVQISTDSAAAFAHRILGQGNLDEFAEKILKPVGMDASDFERFLRHELGIEQLSMTAGVSGRLVTPQEAETMYKLEHQDLQCSLVYYSASNYLASVPVLPEAVAQFYTNQLANYRVPEQVQVNYVKFNVTNFLAAAQTSITNLDQMVQANIDRLGTNLYHGAKTLEESKAAIRAEVIRQHALADARRVAFDFANALDQTTNHSLETFAQQASAKSLAVGTTAPFDHEYGPQDILVPAPFTQKAFGLSDDDRYAGPIEAEDGYYVIAFKQRFPSETPSFAKIETKVTADYRYMNGVQIAQQEALKFGATLTNGIAAGKSFSEICARAAVKPQPLPPFNLNTRSLPEALEDKINLGLLKQVAFSTPPGKASSVAGARDGAFMIYVEKQLPLDEAKMKTELPGFLAYLRSVRENDAFNQWFNAEIQQDPDFIKFIQHLNEEAQMKNGSRRTKS